MRILGIETTSRRGSVALLEEGRVILTRVHDHSPSHAEAMLPLVGELFAEAGWSRSSVDRIAAGTGPGSFTGIRVGLALAKGIALGLDRPGVGIPSLRAMCRVVPIEMTGPRCAVLDGRRNELFVAAYGPDGTEIDAPRVVALGRTDFLEALAGSAVVVGESEVTAPFEGKARPFHSELSDLPHAVGVALAAGDPAEEQTPLEPCYLRAADAKRPAAPESSVSSKAPR